MLQVAEAKCRQLMFDATLTRHLVSGSVMIFGSCHLILFASSTNYFQIVRQQCCLNRIRNTMLLAIVLEISQPEDEQDVEQTKRAQELVEERHRKPRWRGSIMKY